MRGASLYASLQLSSQTSIHSSHRHYTLIPCQGAQAEAGASAATGETAAETAGPHRGRHPIVTLQTDREMTAVETRLATGTAQRGIVHARTTTAVTDTIVKVKDQTATRTEIVIAAGIDSAQTAERAPGAIGIQTIRTTIDVADLGKNPAKSQRETAKILARSLGRRQRKEPSGKSRGRRKRKSKRSLWRSP